MFPSSKEIIFSRKELHPPIQSIAPGGLDKTGYSKGD
jgi:hypothetical protein